MWQRRRRLSACFATPLRRVALHFRQAEQARQTHQVGRKRILVDSFRSTCELLKEVADNLFGLQPFTDPAVAGSLPVGFLLRDLRQLHTERLAAEAELLFLISKGLSQLLAFQVEFMSLLCELFTGFLEVCLLRGDAFAE